MRDLRLRADVSTYDVEALQLRVSRRNLGRAEKGEALLNWATWEKIAKLCSATEEELDLIEGMAKRADEKGWWEQRGRNLRPGFQRFASLELEADRINIYETETVAGLVQTDEYMRALFAMNPLLENTDDLPHMERFRLRRQTKVLGRNPAPQLKLLMPEGVLRREVGGAKALGRQLEHLALVNRRPNIEMRVLTFKSGAHSAMVGSFNLLEFDSADDADTVCVDSLDGSRYVEAQEVVDRFRIAFNATFDQACSLEEVLE